MRSDVISWIVVVYHRPHRLGILPDIPVLSLYHMYTVKIHMHHASVDGVKVFTALHGMQTRSCDENSVRPSVRQTREL